MMLVKFQVGNPLARPRTVSGRFDRRTAPHRRVSKQLLQFEPAIDRQVDWRRAGGPRPDSDVREPRHDQWFYLSIGTCMT